MFKYFQQLRDDRKLHGWTGLVRRRGWRLVALVVAYYLIRDLLLYVILPLAVTAGLQP